MSRPRIPLLAALALVPSLGTSLVSATRGVRRSIGARPGRDHTDSPQWRDGLFHNRLPAVVVEQGGRPRSPAEFATKGRTRQAAPPGRR